MRFFWPFVCIHLPLPAGGQEPAAARPERINAELFWKIRREGTDNSQIMRTIHFLTDLYGPRLTGSPSHKAAAEWAAKQMESWGMKNARLEPWDFKHPGWQNERLSAHIVAPVKDALVCEALAWTPGTNGTVTGRAFQLITPERPTRERLDAYLSSIREQVRGRVVLVGRHQTVPVSFNPPFKRRDEQEPQTFDPNTPLPFRLSAATPPPRPAPTSPRPLPPRVAEAVEQFPS